MATNVLLPQWGMNMEDGVLVKWLVNEGDTVEAGQHLVQVETAKINSELESPASGIVAHIMFEEGSTARVGEIVAVIAAPGEAVPRPDSARPQQAASGAARSASPAGPAAGTGPGVQVTPVARRLARENNIALDAVRGTGPNGRITEEDVRRAIEARKQASARTTLQVVPRARLLAKQHSIDLSEVQGTGPNGRILVEDVERAFQQSRAGIGIRPAAAGAEVAEVIPLRGLRRTIAERMMLSVQSMAQVTLTTEADVTEAVRLRESLVSQWRQHRIRPLDIDIIVKATAAALREHPRLNALLVNDEIRVMKDIHIGAAMAVPDGLLVPVIRHADSKDLLTIAKEIRDLADRSRKGVLTVDDMAGASFTITSLANYEIDVFTPLIDPPQVAILGVGRVVEKPSVHQGQITVRSMTFLSLAFDHRALDGVPAGDFLHTVKRKLEDPSWIKCVDKVKKRN